MPPPDPTLSRRLALDHVSHDAGTDELVEALEQTDRVNNPPTDGAAAEDKPDPRDAPVYPFPFSFTDRRGREWKGDFVNRIIGFKGEQQAAVLAAKFMNYTPWDAIEPAMRELTINVAHMTLSLEKEGRPKWAKDLRAIDDVQLLVALWGWVSSHETRYFRLGEAAPDSEAES